MTDKDQTLLTTTETPIVAAPSRRQWGLAAAFSLGGFLSAFLLFTIEPMAAKSLLPTMGGSAAVWNTAMAFFQVTLLLGYLAAHVLNTRVPPRGRRWVQLALLATPLLLLPFDFSNRELIGSPLWWEISVLAGAVGAPFLALSSFSPTIQTWFAGTEHPRAADPFFLYAASNIGSFLGLLAYPFLIEPALGLTAQAGVFRWSYLLLVILAGVLASRVRSVSVAADPGPTLTWSQRRRWVFWAAVPSLTLLAVTRHLATDVASFPLLWVVPLALYLATFILSFSKWSETATKAAGRGFPFVAILALTAGTAVLPILWLALAIPLVLLICSGLLGHGRLYADRPPAGRLTEFYLWISVGGAVGGLAAAFLAPIVFNSIAEYPVALVASAFLLTGSIDAHGRKRRVLLVLFVGALLLGLLSPDFTLIALAVGVAGVFAYRLAGQSVWFAPMLALALVVAASHTEGEVLARERTFYGVYKVLSNDDGNHVMVSGTTVHGVQRFLPTPVSVPLAYYVPEGPFGQIMINRASASDFGVIGLGAGALASYLAPQQTLTFYEIDPAVVELAIDRDLFTLTSDSAGTIEFVEGDGRLTIAQSDGHEVIIIDAFTSDAIPTHLLTLEAVAGYLERLDPGGIIGFHISNRHLDLEPVVGRVAQELGLVALATDFQPTTIDGSATSFVVVGRGRADVADFASLPNWRPARIGVDLWTDEFSNLLGVLR